LLSSTNKTGRHNITEILLKVALNTIKQTGQIKDSKFGICCFSSKHASLRSKNKDWLAQNRDNVSKWSDFMKIKLKQ
jgi:hypothetical protein